MMDMGVDRCVHLHRDGTRDAPGVVREAPGTAAGDY
jgi:hypothetical protein